MIIIHTIFYAKLYRNLASNWQCIIDIIINASLFKIIIEIQVVIENVFEQLSLDESRKQKKKISCETRLKYSTNKQNR